LIIKEVSQVHPVGTFRTCLLLVLSASLIAAFPSKAGPPEGKGKPHKEHEQEKAQKPAKGKQEAQTAGPKSASKTATSLVSASTEFDKARRIAVANQYTG
jgi:hypothetical protein